MDENDKKVALSQERQDLVVVMKTMQQALRELRRLNEGPMRSRHLSISITHLEDSLLRLRESWAEFLESEYLL